MISTHLLQGATPAELDRQIAAHVKNGWQPLGVTYAFRTLQHVVFSKIMIRTDDKTFIMKEHAQ